MLKILPIAFAIIAISLSTYGLITRDYQLNFLMIFFLGLSMLTLGIREFQSKRKAYGLFLIGVFFFSTYASIQSFIWR
ncbi:MULTISPECIES: DUF3953 domain-containing protein [Lysinibacillus]|uniref:DUF3953 domain-containing protein n=1 Tax=Lysinibacillus TaxID=400634 RepID=UPI00055F328D|nr:MULTISPECIES: DUF3953 domain-containing protein [Lysinibacillus]KUF35831.1 hypothetical protein AK833_05855 [Lysinibacillus sp. F5]WCH45885.1 DUF3953 domain-containing protein [Lysinibacillus sp. OF-1]SCY36497.1 Protein of unknown function [Lysinibacillus sp. SG9]SDB18324.1 Protein of unknown function [Lysinibacillus sp. TC-37]SFS66133.1 Protein of unknown function [Lysinibacillus sp. SG55]